MLVKIFKEVLEKYPHAEIGFCIADINVQKTCDEFTDKLKNQLAPLLNESNITKKNFASNPQISGWRSVFKDFGMDPKTHCSSVEALLKRIVAGSKMWNISNAVDIYNCFSVLSLIPMGAYDLDKIKSNIFVRYGKTGESFEPLGATESVTVYNNHVVYSDDENVITWLWNYRDSKHSSITDATKRAIFFLDSAFVMNHLTMKEAVLAFEECLTKAGATVHSNGVLSKDRPEIEVSLDKPVKLVTGKTNLIESLLQKQRKVYPEDAAEKISVVPIKEMEQMSIATERTNDDMVAIHFAATGNLDGLKKIINSNSSVAQCKDWFGNSLLMHAVVGNHYETVFWLLSTNKFDLKCKNQNGDDSLSLANRHKNLKIMNLLK